MSLLPYVFSALVVVVLFVWYERRSTMTKCSPLIAMWATKEDMQVIDIAYPFIKHGPYLWRATKMQRVFRVTVQATNHSHHQIVWLRIGHMFWGLNKPKIDVEYEMQKR